MCAQKQRKPFWSSTCAFFSFMLFCAVQKKEPDRSQVLRCASAAHTKGGVARIRTQRSVSNGRWSSGKATWQHSNRFESTTNQDLPGPMASTGYPLVPCISNPRGFGQVPRPNGFRRGRPSWAKDSTSRSRLRHRSQPKLQTKLKRRNIQAHKPI